MRTATRRSSVAAIVLSIAVVAGWTSAPAFAAYPRGVDVSNWQGNVNWNAVAQSGRSFEFAKASEGTGFTDGYYAGNHSNARAAGLKTGAYHFARPAYDPIAQADHFVDVASLGNGDLLPVLDLEDSGGLGTSSLVSWVHRWLDRVQSRTGVRPIIYTYSSFWPDYMGDTTEFADAGYPLWIANYGVSWPSVPANNWSGRGWTFWQFSDSGSVPGISGSSDEDYYRHSDFSPVTIGATTGVKPSAETGGAGALRPNAASVSGTSNPNGQATTYHFDYGTSTSYGSQAPSPDGNVGSDKTVHTVGTQLTGLKANTTYHYRLVATNASGTSYGADRTFTTPTPSKAYRDAVLGTSGLVDYWRLGERSGTTMIDSKHAHNGTYVNGPRLGVFGALLRDPNTAVEFNGANQYAKVARAVRDNFSIEFWFRSTGGVGTGNRQWWQGAGLIDAEVPGTNNDFGTSLGADGRILAGTGNPDTSIASPTGYNNGAWHHVVFTRTRATGALTLYVDGVRVASGRGGTQSLTSPSTLKLGVLRTGHNWFKGRLDEAAVYRVALPASVVAQHYRVGRTG